MNLYSMIKGVLLAVIFLALMVGWFLVGQNVEQTGSCDVARAS